VEEDADQQEHPPELRAPFVQREDEVEVRQRSDEDVNLPRGGGSILSHASAAPDKRFAVVSPGAKKKIVLPP